MTAGVAAVLAFSSCDKIAVEEENEMPSAVAGQGNGSAKLNVITRAGIDNGEDNVVAEGRVYIFNSIGKCVQLLSTDEETSQATAQLAAGSYALYAIGGDDLSRFTLPSQSEATPTSVITLIDGKVMDDLMVASANVELEDGETVNQNLALKHAVMCVEAVEINQVPPTVTKVEVSLTPLYSSVQLNGEYPDSPTESYKLLLTKQSDGRTWKATPDQMLFPSKGNPTIKVSITTDEGVMGYSYNATEELPANHHITIIGTYKATQGVSLTGILTDGGWGEDRTITFDLDDSNQAVYEPVAGHFTNGYYVVSVNEASRTAVLLSQSEVSYVPPTDESSSDKWKEALNAAMAAHEKPLGISGNWRLPTKAEAEIFTQDPKAIYYDNSSSPFTSASIFCLDGDVLNWAESRTEDHVTYTFHSGSKGITSSANIYLRPVIDITY